MVNVKKSTTVAVNRGTVSIAVGAAASEVDIVPDIQLSYNGGNSASTTILMPIQIPAGTRISARARGGDTYIVQVILFEGGFASAEGGAGADLIGASLATPTTITTGLANTKGSYSQLVASSAKDYIGFVLCVDNAANSGMPAFSFLIDIAIGGAGSEQAIVPNFYFDPSGMDDVTLAFYFPINIPSGTRIAARAQASGASKTLGISLLGVYQ